MPITAASLSVAIHWSSSIFGRRLLILLCTKWKLLFLKTAHSSLLYYWEPLIGSRLRLIPPQSTSRNQKKVLLFLHLIFGKQTRFSSRFKQTMLAKPQALMDSYLKNSEVAMFFRVFSGKELRDFFEEKWQMPKNMKIVEIQAFSLLQTE